MKHVMPTLTQGLIDACKVRPDDAIDYLVSTDPALSKFGGTALGQNPELTMQTKPIYFYYVPVIKHASKFTVFCTE